MKQILQRLLMLGSAAAFCGHCAGGATGFSKGGEGGADAAVATSTERDTGEGTPAGQPQMVTGAFLACVETPSAQVPGAGQTDVMIGCGAFTNAGPVDLSRCSPSLNLYADADATALVEVLPSMPGAAGANTPLLAALPLASRNTGSLRLVPNCSSQFSVASLKTSAIVPAGGDYPPQMQGQVMGTQSAGVADAQSGIPANVNAMALWNGGINNANVLGSVAQDVAGKDAFAKGINPGDFCDSDGTPKTKLQPSSFNGFLVSMFDSSIFTDILTTNGQQPISTTIVPVDKPIVTSSGQCFTSIKNMNTAEQGLALAGNKCVFARRGNTLFIVKLDPARSWTQQGVQSYLAALPGCT